jgi:hypothetical protein
MTNLEEGGRQILEMGVGEGHPMHGRACPPPSIVLEERGMGPPSCPCASVRERGMELQDPSSTRHRVTAGSGAASRREGGGGEARCLHHQNISSLSTGAARIWATASRLHCYRQHHRGRTYGSMLIESGGGKSVRGRGSRRGGGRRVGAAGEEGDEIMPPIGEGG